MRGSGRAKHMDETKVAENFEEAEEMLREAEAEIDAAREVSRIQDADVPDFGAPDLKDPPAAKAGTLDEELDSLRKNAQETRLSAEVAAAEED